ncbi:hypothetical protein EJD97_013867, partial [Solanum chilense]
AQSADDQQAGGSGSPEPTTSIIWTPSVVYSASKAQSAVPPSISTVLELDAPHLTLLLSYDVPPPQQARLSSQPPSHGATSSMLKLHPPLDPYASWHALEGEEVESLKWRIGPPSLYLQQALQKWPQTQAP